MCVKPNMLSDGTLVGCRNCWQCSERAITDWSGRCIAESKTSTASNAITLTYGRGLEGKNKGKVSHERAHVLTYSDVQKYFKRLRKDGYKCRYFVTGEFGGLKGRTHWHAIVFWDGDVPEHELDKEMYMQKHWHHGFSHWKQTHPGSVSYACKYVQKDLDDAEAQGHLAMSKKPPLGARYFADRAQKYVDQWLAPQDLFYGFHEARDGNGKKIKFMLSGRSAELFVQEYVLRWRGYPVGYAHEGKKKKMPDGQFRRAVGARHGPPCPVRGWHYPDSELVEQWEDKWTRDANPGGLFSFEYHRELADEFEPRKEKEWQKTIETNPDAPVDPAEFVRWSQRASEYATRMQPEFQD